VSSTNDDGPGPGSEFDQLIEPEARSGPARPEGQAEGQAKGQVKGRAEARAEAALRRARHQIRNELQLLTSLHALHIRRVDDPRARHELIRCYRRVGVVGVVHQLTADSGGTVSADTCLQTVADFLEASARTMQGNCSFDLILQFEPLRRWHHDHATRIALIVDELFSNAVDHALPHATRLELELGLQEVDGRTCLRLRDWGPGLPESFEPASQDSLGLPMVCAVAQQLGGSLELIPAPGGGTEARLWLPSELAVEWDEELDPVQA
jgi:two-component sensor histidine kinase